MICSRPYPNCPECGDTLIHQDRRGPHESSSHLGQWVHDSVALDMFWLDIDGVSLRNETRVLRIVEGKPRGGSMSNSQKTALPLLAKAVQLLASTGLIHEQSGVFVVYSDHPHDVALVEQVKGWQSRAVQPVVELGGEAWTNFLRGKVMEIGDAA